MQYCWFDRCSKEKHVEGIHFCTQVVLPLFHVVEEVCNIDLHHSLFPDIFFYKQMSTTSGAVVHCS